MGDNGFNTTAIVVSTLLVTLTLVATYVAARRTKSTSDYWTAGGGLSGRTNGIAIAGDFLSSSSLLGYAGLAFLFGLDGVLYAIAACAIFLMVLFMIAEKLRNLGKFTFADALALRLRAKPVRAISALSTLSVAIFYLLAQLVAGGVLMEALAGIDFSWGVVVAAALMLAYVLFGGMLATTWVQVIKAVMLMAVVSLLVILVLIKVDPNPISVINMAAENTPIGDAFLGTGGSFSNPWNLISMGVAVTLSAVGLPHVLMRFFTVPDAVQARKSALWAVGLIGVFNVLIAFLGLSARAVLGTDGIETAGAGGNLALPALAQYLGGGQTFGGDLVLALLAAVAFATILAVTAGLVLNGSSAVAHDLWTNLLGRREAEERAVGRVSAIVLVAIAVVITLVIGSGQNVTFLAVVATSIAASANFPVLLLTLTWSRMRTMGAIVGALSGLISAILLIVLSPAVWPGGADAAPFPLAYPILISLPIGFLGCYLGSILSRDADDPVNFARLKTRALTGYGAEKASSEGH
ncbi:solute symporter family protein [Williamsia muralis]|uniref:solute symporter family protein n=1 Tax=Williamsia marianensis TaxID=85044 RepID=UPI0038102708